MQNIHHIVYPVSATSDIDYLKTIKTITKICASASGKKHVAVALFEESIKSKQSPFTYKSRLFRTPKKVYRDKQTDEKIENAEQKRVETLFAECGLPIQSVSSERLNKGPDYREYEKADVRSISSSYTSNPSQEEIIPADFAEIIRKIESKGIAEQLKKMMIDTLFSTLSDLNDFEKASLQFGEQKSVILVGREGVYFCRLFTGHYNKWQTIKYTSLGMKDITEPKIAYCLMILLVKTLMKHELSKKESIDITGISNRGEYTPWYGFVYMNHALPYEKEANGILVELTRPCRKPKSGLEEW